MKTAWIGFIASQLKIAFSMIAHCVVASVYSCLASFASITRKCQFTAISATQLTLTFPSSLHIDMSWALTVEMCVFYL